MGRKKEWCENLNSGLTFGRNMHSWQSRSHDIDASAWVGKRWIFVSIVLKVDIALRCIAQQKGAGVAQGFFGVLR